MLGSLGVPVIARSLFPIGSPYYYATITRGHAHPHGPTYRTAPCTLFRTHVVRPDRSRGSNETRGTTRRGTARAPACRPLTPTARLRVRAVPRST
jgi:hypothetical protein